MAEDQQKPEVTEEPVAETQETAVAESTPDVAAAEAPVAEVANGESTPDQTVETPADAPDTPPAEPVAASGSETGEEVTETVAEEVEAEAPKAEPVPRPVVKGFKGEITGEVFKLADLFEREEGIGVGPVYDNLRGLVEKTLTNVAEQDIVPGKVVSVGEKDVVIDIGFKSDGIVSKNEFDHELAAGDVVEVFLERMEDRHGQLVLSKTKADTVRRWRKVEEAFENESVLEGTIIRRIKGGMIVDLFEGLEAFLPGSQIDVRPVRDFDAYLEKRMEFKIVKLNPANENIVVSHKALIEKDLQAQREKILGTMEPGQILEGIVKNITDFGVFIDLGGVDGLLHITDLSWGRVAHPSELVTLDEKLNVVVLDYDRERQRISLGLKQLQPHPWEAINERFIKSSVVEGKVVSITDYGAFVELEKGIEGLVHISEMSWTEHIRHPSQMVSLGQVVQVKILNIDNEGKKISLGMKQLEPDPWDNIAERYPPGTVMRGKVRNITNFGVFAEIEPGIDGLVHISDLSWTKTIRHPSEMVKKGQELDIVILNIDPSERRISLGHKQVETNPWNQFSQIYTEGSDTEGKVVRIEDKGVIVELPLDVEAFIPVGELKNPSHFDHTYHEGDQLDGLTVIKFDANNKEIVVSETASARAEEYAARRAEQRERREEAAQERREVSKYSNTATAASGPTTLGELSGLAELKRKMEKSEAASAKAEAKAAEAEAKATEEAKADEVKAEDAKAATEAPAEVKAEKEVKAKPKAKKAPAKKKTTTKKAAKKADEAEAEAVVEAEAKAEAGSEKEA